ncbi:MAG TPA: hypothetical protein VLF71_00515 [Candidatus Saccharimonadales bacterium]|nr:hypothetical protein [Candidatus Saccharimonadales bacterium]
MKTDPPATPAPAPPTPAAGPASPQPPRPRGKVFDVMRPGRAPASPTSRPVVIGHKLQAQHTQVTVSGIGEAAPREPLHTHKAPAVQKVDVTGGDVAAPPAPVIPAVPVPPATSAASAASAGPADLPVDVPESAQAPALPAPESTPEAVPEEKSEPSTAKPTAPPAGQPKPDELAAIAMEPDAPPPAVSVPEPPLPKLPIPEVADDDPVHNIAEPSLKGQVVVSHHSASTEGPGKLIALAILTIIFLLLVLDVLMDAGVISTSVIPHTHFF